MSYYNNTSASPLMLQELRAAFRYLREYIRRNPADDLAWDASDALRLFIETQCADSTPLDRASAEARALRAHDERHAADTGRYEGDRGSHPPADDWDYGDIPF